MAVTGYDATLLALASAFGGAIVSGLFTLAGARLNHRHEARREQERAGREDRRERDHAERQSHERLDDLRRIECVRLINSAERLVASWPRELTDDDRAVVGSARAGLEDADDTLQLLGPESLARASSDLASVTRRRANGGQNLSLSSEYMSARAEFYRVAKKALGYDLGPASAA